MNIEMLRDDGLPLNGITVETKDDRTSIDISVGENTESHQTHNIINPTRIALDIQRLKWWLPPAKTRRSENMNGLKAATGVLQVSH
jgi:hypothetical protein